ncbi:MAG: cryptochrome/photolyase family protein [Bryobacteraceae bacterium]
MQPVLLWFRLDLRLTDNPALRAAVASGAPVIPVFLWAPEEEDPWPPGAASRCWLYQSLSSLQSSLVKSGSRLIIRRGSAQETLQKVLSETNARAIFWNRRYEPALVARDAKLKRVLAAQGTETYSFNSALLFEPWTVLGSSGQPYQVFTAFWKACLKQPEPPVPAAAPRTLPRPSRWPQSLAVADLGLMPKVDWAGGIRATWTPGEKGARRELARFLKRDFAQYATERNLPARTSTSRLSPHLHFGEISPHTVWHSLRKRRTAENAQALDAYLREIGWREFAHHLLFHFPFTTNEPLRQEFAFFPWRNNRALLEKWQRGNTGYPFVDAGMRELWATGWMHNRLRLVVASFLVKHLRLRWEEGAYWFWDTLVDADLANNTLGWQWTAGCGADAAPYFRIFNPVLQSEKFDQQGEYVRHWVPELANLPAAWIHKPWMAPPAELVKAGVELESDYPLPVVDHDEARREALEGFERIHKPVRARARG